MVRRPCRHPGRRSERERRADEATAMTGKSYPPMSQHWSFLAAIIATGGTPKKADIVASLRMATPEIDNIIKLLHTPEVAYFLQTTEPRDAVVEQFVEALRALMFRPMDVVPADVQHYVADLLDPPPSPAGRPKVFFNDMLCLFCVL